MYLCEGGMCKSVTVTNHHHAAAAALLGSSEWLAGWPVLAVVRRAIAYTGDDRHLEQTNRNIYIYVYLERAREKKRRKSRGEKAKVARLQLVFIFRSANTIWGTHTALLEQSWRAPAERQRGPRWRRHFGKENGDRPANGGQPRYDGHGFSVTVLRQTSHFAYNHIICPLSSSSYFFFLLLLLIFFSLVEWFPPRFPFSCPRV